MGKLWSTNTTIKKTKVRGKTKIKEKSSCRYQKTTQNKIKNQLGSNCKSQSHSKSIKEVIETFIIEKS